MNRLSGPNRSSVSCQAIDNFETHPTKGSRAGTLPPCQRAWSWRSRWLVVLTGYQGMVASVLPASDYHQPMHCSFFFLLQFKQSQCDRTEVVPQNLRKISLCSGKIKENLRGNCGIASVGKRDLPSWRSFAHPEAEELSAPDL